jgi:hypothetical protein
MTVKELTKLLENAADHAHRANQVPDMTDVLRHLAEFIHIDQKGFAKSDLEQPEPAEPCGTVRFSTGRGIIMLAA